MVQTDLFKVPKKPWNAGRIVGAKAPLKPKHFWAIRQQLKSAGNLGFEAKKLRPKDSLLKINTAIAEAP